MKETIKNMIKNASVWIVIAYLLGMAAWFGTRTAKDIWPDKREEVILKWEMPKNVCDECKEQDK